MTLTFGENFINTSRLSFTTRHPPPNLITSLCSYYNYITVVSTAYVATNCAIFLHLKCNKYKTRIPIVYWEFNYLYLTLTLQWILWLSQSDSLSAKDSYRLFSQRPFWCYKKKKDILATDNNSNMAQFIVVKNTTKLASKCINFPCIIIVPYEWIFIL